MTFFNPKELFVSYKEFKQINPRKWWWPGMTLALVIAAWCSIGFLIDSSYRATQANVQSAVKIHQEETLGQITKFIDKVNLVGQFIEYEHNEGVDAVELAAFTRKILHSTSQSWTVSFINHTNFVVNSTNPKRVGAIFTIGKGAKYSSKWSVVKTEHHSLFPLPTVHFIRSLPSTSQKGADHQIISISENDLLFEGRFMLEQGITALMSTQGELLASNGNVALKDVDTLYNNLSATTELTVLPNKYFMDKTAHTVAWTLPENIPLILVTGFSNKDLYAEYEDLKLTYLVSGVAITVVLSFLGFLATMMYCKLVQQQLKKQELESAYRSATECAMDGFYILNAIYDEDAVVDFIVQDCNRRGASMLGLNKQKLIGSTLSDIVSYDLFQRLSRKYVSTMSIGVPPPPDEFLIESLKPAELRGKWVSHRCSYHKMGVAVTLRDITEEKTNLHTLTFNAEHDAVTGLPNRTWLLHHMPRYLEELATKQELAYFLFVDLDRFKYVNDTHGHEVGDILLREVGQRLKNTLRAGDIVTRIGGDEFIIAIYNNARLVNIDEVCSRLITEMHKPFDINNLDIQIGASIGVSIFPRHADNLSDIMNNADAAMYAVKKASKGAYMIFDSPQIPPPSNKL